MVIDPSLWVLLAFVALIFLVGRRSWHSLRQHLDQRAETIHQDIKEAQRLKEEAQFTLDHALRLQKEMAKRSDEILAHSEIEIDRLKQEAQETLEVFRINEEKQMAERLQQLETQALHEIEEKAVQIAFKAAEKVIAANINDETDHTLKQKAVHKILDIPS